MNRAAIYISLLAVFILSIIYFTGRAQEHNTIFHWKGYEYVEVHKKDIQTKLRKDLMFTIEDPFEHTLELYHVGNYRGQTDYDLYHSKGDFGKKTSNEIFIAAIQGQIAYDDTLRMGRNQIYALTIGAVNSSVVLFPGYDTFQDQMTFNGKKYIYLFGFPFIWIIFLLISELIILMVNFFTIRHLDLCIKSILVLILVFIIGRLFRIPSQSMTYTGIFLFVIPTFCLFQWLFYALRRSIPLADHEALKFIILLVGLTISGFFTQPLHNIFGWFEQPPFWDQMHIHFTLAFIIAFGNLIFNILKYLISLIGIDKKLAIANQEVLQRDSTLNTLASSVNPHFLYNSLNSIAELVNEDANKAQQMTLGLSKFYKYVTNRDENPISTIGEEIEIINTYLEIEKIRFEERLTYKIICEKDIYDLTIPFFILQPLVENAIKYGYSNETDKIEIEIHIRADEELIVIKIFDIGLAFDEELSKGFGLKSVTSKLKYHHPNNHEIAFINHPAKHILIEIKR